jgi:peptidoglycan/xylan/chitin deacetylase (PgdA/CDA1 family)
MSGSIPILMYHNIGLPPHDSKWPALYVSAHDFKQQMLWLRRLGFHGRSVREAMPQLNAISATKVAVITFDDGYCDIYENALPILQEFGFTATCYFVSSCFGSYNCWDREELSNRKLIMTRDQASGWSKAGMEIGSHTSGHSRLTSCTPELCDREIIDSKSDLEQKFGTSVESFSYPFGDHNAYVASRVQAAGYRSAVTTRPGRAQPGGDPFRMRRIGVSGRRGLAAFVVAATTNYQNWRDPRRRD